MKKGTQNIIIFYAGAALAIFGPMLLLPLFNDCLLDWFGAAGGQQLSTKWKIAATVSCSFITMLVLFLALRSTTPKTEAWGILLFLWSAFMWCMIAGTVYYTIIL